MIYKASAILFRPQNAEMFSEMSPTMKCPAYLVLKAS